MVSPVLISLEGLHDYPSTLTFPPLQASEAIDRDLNNRIDHKYLSIRTLSGDLGRKVMAISYGNKSSWELHCNRKYPEFYSLQNDNTIPLHIEEDCRKIQMRDRQWVIE